MYRCHCNINSTKYFKTLRKFEVEKKFELLLQLFDCRIIKRFVFKYKFVKVRIDKNVRIIFDRGYLFAFCTLIKSYNIM